LLHALQEERREYHRDLKNANRKVRKFSPGDLVAVKVQVQTTPGGGEPAKSKITARGPYRVLEEVHQGTYMIQRVPFAKGQGRSGKPYKESVARMEL
jgi:hypothetical protein